MARLVTNAFYMPFLNNLIGPSITSYIAYAFFQRSSLLRRTYDSLMGKATRINNGYETLSQLVKSEAVGKGSTTQGIAKIVTKFEKDFNRVLKNCDSDKSFSSSHKHQYKSLISMAKDEALNLSEIKRRSLILKTAGDPGAVDFIILLLMFTLGILSDGDILHTFIGRIADRVFPILLVLAGFAYHSIFSYNRREIKQLMKNLDELECLIDFSLEDLHALIVNAGTATFQKNPSFRKNQKLKPAHVIKYVKRKVT